MIQRKFFFILAVAGMLFASLAVGCAAPVEQPVASVADSDALEEAQQRIAELEAQLTEGADENVAALEAELEEARETLDALSDTPADERLGQILPGYVMEEGTLLLTPQPELIEANLELKPDYTVENGSDLTFVYITKTLLNPYFVAADRGAKARCEAMGVECLFFVPEKPDNPEEQIRMVEDAINRGVDGILIFPVDSRAVSSALQKATDAGIPVVGLGTVAFDAELVAFVSADYYGRSLQMAEILGEQLVEQFGAANVVTIDGVPGAQNAKDMKAGYLDGLAGFNQISVLASQTGYWKRLEGLAAMENLLQRYPEVHGVIAADDESALGAVQALEAAGYKVNEEVLVAGFNATHDAVCAIKEGRLYATDNADPGNLAAAGMEFLVRHAVDGENFPPEIPWPLPQDRFYVTPGNIDEYWPNAWALSDEEKAAGECLD